MGFHLAENGTVNAKTSIERFVGNGADEGVGGIQGLFELATNDYVELYLSNESGTGNLQLEHLTFVAVEVP
jgi:hypothetical protein